MSFFSGVSTLGHEFDVNESTIYTTVGVMTQKYI